MFLCFFQIDSMSERSKSISQNKTTSEHESAYTSQFAGLTRRYKKFCRRIKDLVNETERSYNEIFEKRILPLGKISETKRHYYRTKSFLFVQ